jgi:uncharacterized membrane protein YvlD (DUF360 family)
MMHGFSVDSIWWAMLTAIVVTIVGWAGSAFIGPRGRLERFTGGRKKL